MKAHPRGSGLFDADGALQRHLFDAKAWSVLESTVTWLTEVGRSLFLPIDLIVVLLRAGHDELGEQLARAARGSGRTSDILADLETLARKVDRETSGEPRLQASHFSLGFMGILEDALNWAREAGWDRITEDDLVRVVRWRADVQESASVRWAIRQLAAPGGERLFDNDGVLKPTAFAEPSWRFMQEAMQLAADNGMPFLGTPHLVAVLCSVRDSILWRAAEGSGVDPRKLREELLRIVGVRSPAHSAFLLSRRTMTPRLVRMLTYASDRAVVGDGRIGEAHLVEGFVEDGGSSLELIRALGLEQEIRNLLGEPKVLEGATIDDVDGEDVGRVGSPTPMLDLLGRDLTREANEGKLPMILGRERELRRMINVLLRREQRNPLLTGEAGVGKTALAVALANRVASGKVPRRLKGVRVVEINGAGLIGGTSYRGDLEARIKALLAEARNDVVLFVDEAHAVFAPRSGSGQPAEVPNHFKAALANGDVAVVAATTDAEFHRWLEQDPALKRRFERIEVPEPERQLTRSILESLVEDFESDYEVRIGEDAVHAAIDLSVRFLPEQRMPDKAKKLLMDAAIATSIEAAEREALERAEASVAHTGENEVVSVPRDLGDDAADLHETGDDDELASAADSRSGEVPRPRPRVDRTAVARQVSLKTGLPLDRLVQGEKGWWVGLSKRLAPYAPGQLPAVESTSRALVSGRLRSDISSGPQGVFVFLGPPAVGKASLARGLAKEIFANPKALIRLNMTDFQEGHAISRLIGTPPGYVGYQDEDALVTPLRRRPSSVVLLEDFDRAHPQVQDRFLALFEEGTITDTRGMTADARHAIFVLTVTTPPGEEVGRIGFTVESGDAAPRERAREMLDLQAPELSRRLRGYPHEVITFRAADSDRGLLMNALFEQRLARFRASLLENYGLQLDIEASVEEAIRAAACGLKDARDLQQLFSRRIIDPVTDQLLRGVRGGTVGLGPSEEQFDELAGAVSEEVTATPLPVRTKEE